MKNLLLAGTLLLGFSSAFAQENWCGTDQHQEAIFDANPLLRTQMHEHLMRVTSGELLPDEREDECIIPVVVHILHNNGAGNISDEQVQSGIDMLNEDFNRENADASDTRNTADAPFAPYASDMEIRFELAKIDEDGNCTNGIERRFVGSQSYNADDAQKHYASGGLDAWNRNYYFNIWIVNSIESGGEGTILGYAEFPYGGGSSNYGVIIRNDAYGSTGTAGGDRTLSHEVGHCLGLLHTFQGGCHGGSCDSGGDYCCDTPPVVSAQWSCVPTQNTCDEPAGDTYGFDALDQFENFMSYSPCQNMFSEDQKSIVLSNLSSIAFLANLVDPDHHDETGVGTPGVLCKAEFSADKTTICAGDAVNYIDASYANVTGWSWNFEGGSPATSSEENPTITYDTPGIYEVELEVTDGASTESTTKTEYILVLPNPGISLPYTESFETIDVIPDNDRFSILDEDLEDTWEIKEGVAYTGDHCVYIPNRGNDNYSKDDLISGTIDLSDVDPDDDMIFTFKYAYKKRYPSNDEWLRFFISNDCGETWALRKNIHGDDLSEEHQSASYTPEDESEWTEVTITNINSSYYSSNFRFKFQFENDNGNNIYIDDINLYPASMAHLVENKASDFDLSVYPNPANEALNVNLVLPTDAELDITIVNAVGQTVETVYNGNLYAGEVTLSQDIQSLPEGVYFIRVVNTNGTSETIKFIKG